MDSHLPIALVTGGTRGLGRAIVDVLAPDHHVLVGGRSLGAVDEVLSSIPSGGAFVCDLADQEAVARTVEDEIAPLGHLEVLVHNAGIARRGTVENSSRHLWREIFEVDVFAVADLTRLTLPYLRAANGLVVAINSGAGLRGFPGDAAYASAKFALRGLTEVLRAEERGRVRVTSIHPGRIDTDMQVFLQGQDGRPYEPSEHMDPRDVARAVRVAVDTPPSTSIDDLQVRPVTVLR